MSEAALKERLQQNDSIIHNQTAKKEDTPKSNQ